MVLNPIDFLHMIYRLPREDWGEAYLSVIDSCEKFNSEQAKTPRQIRGYIGKRIRWALINCQRREWCIRWLDQHNENSRRTRAEYIIDPYLLRHFLIKKRFENPKEDYDIEYDLSLITKKQNDVVNLRLRGLTFKQIALVSGTTRDNVRQLWWTAIKTIVSRIENNQAKP